MEELIQKRRQAFHQACFKYLRYVFNDHFILVLMFLLGFVAVQYANLIHDFPKGSLLPVLIAVLVGFVLSFLGRLATYMAPADGTFCLPQEISLQANLKKAAQKSFLVWGGCQFLVTILLVPIFQLSGWQLWQVILYFAFLLVLRTLYLHHQVKRFYKGSLLDITSIIAYERQRQQRLLTFFSLFTRVKGLTNTTKPRPYLNPLLGFLTKTSKPTVWLSLYARAFLRNGDYFWLSLRLLVLSLVLGFALPSWWGVSLVALFNYLILFQLLGLYRVYDAHTMTKLYPTATKLKSQAFQTFLVRVSLLITLPQMSLIFLNWRFLAILPIMIGLNLVYLPHQLKKLVD